MPRLPPDVAPTRRTRTFDEDTVPAGLLADHTTRAGVWARIVVEAGALRYAVEGGGSWLLTPGADGIVAPTVPHRVTPVGPVRFHVQFLEVPAR